MQGFFLVIFALFWSGFMLFFDAGILSQSWKQYRSSSFQTTAGVITRSNVRSHRGSKGGTTYSPDIAFSYRVDSQKYTGNKFRFTPASKSRSAVEDIVNGHPVGSEVTVYYDREEPTVALLDPGLHGGDLLPLLFLTPFNAFMLGLWAGVGGWLRERIFRPVAGGVKLINDGGTIRVRLPQLAPVWWGIWTAAGLSFVSIFAVGLPTSMQPSMPVAAATIAAVYGIAIIVWLRQWQIASTGVDDLVIDRFNRKLTLPETCGRKTLITVAVPDIQAIWVEKVMHTSSKGGVSYTYAPTLHMPKSETSFQKLADWSDQRKADDFAQWLSKQINVPIEGTEPAPGFVQSPSSPGAPRS